MKRFTEERYMPRKKKEETENTVDPISLGTHLALSDEGQSKDGKEDELRKTLNALLVEQLHEQIGAREAESERRKNRMVEMRTELEQERLERQLRQNSCSHLKEDQKSALAGQELSNGQLYLACQKCRKTFTEEDLKQNTPIIPKGDNIGRSAGSW